jgi:hypothetical protein
VRDLVETWLYFYVTDRSRLAKIFVEENEGGWRRGWNG